MTACVGALTATGAEASVLVVVGTTVSVLVVAVVAALDVAAVAALDVAVAPVAGAKEPNPKDTFGAAAASFAAPKPVRAFAKRGIPPKMSSFDAGALVSALLLPASAPKPENVLFEPNPLDEPMNPPLEPKPLPEPNTDADATGFAATASVVIVGAAGVTDAAAGGATIEEALEAEVPNPPNAGELPKPPNEAVLPKPPNEAPLPKPPEPKDALMPPLPPDSFADEEEEEGAVLKGDCAAKPNDAVLELELLLELELVLELAAVVVAVVVRADVNEDVKDVGKEKLEAAAGAVAAGGEVTEDASVDLLGDTTDGVAA